MDYKTGLWHFVDELRRAAKFLEEKSNIQKILTNGFK